MPANEATAKYIFEAIRARGKCGVALLIGAGCSKTAEIPDANELSAMIRERWPERCQGSPDKGKSEYEWLTDKLSPGEFRRLFASRVHDPRPNVAHICIAELVNQGVVDRVLTTNFDSLLIHACAMGQRFPLIHDCSVAEEVDDWIDEEGSAIFYLHGHDHGRRMLNPGKLHTPEVERARAPTVAGEVAPARMQATPLEESTNDRWGRVSRIVMGTIRRRLLIVCGYSGLSDKVFDALRQADEIENPVFWMAYGPQDKDNVFKQFESSKLENRIYVIEKYGADEFFYQLLLELEKEPPSWLRTPGDMTTLATDRICWPKDLEWEAWKEARRKGLSGLAPSDDRLKDLEMTKEPPPWRE